MAYDKQPTRSEGAWYNYENMLQLKECSADTPQQIADIVRDAYARFEKALLCNQQ